MSDLQQPHTHDGFRPEDHFVIAPAKQPDVFYASSPVAEDLILHKRQPHLGYAALLLLIGGLALVVVSIVVGVIGLAAHMHIDATGKDMPKASILMEAVTFGVTYAIAFFVFPRYWRRSFGRVLEWNAAAARAHVPQLLAVGVALSVVAQALESLLTLPKEMPVDAFFKQPSTIWLIAIFGTFVAPVCEEIFFRGFLLRGFAIFFDWISRRETIWWSDTDQLTQRSMIASGVLTSGLFAAMHAAQLGWAWNAVGVLWIVGGGLTWVRIRYNSVAASSLVHAAYNGLLFAIMFVLTGGFRHLDKLANH